MNFFRRQFLGSSLLILGSTLMDALTTPLWRWRGSLLLQAAAPSNPASSVQFVHFRLTKPQIDKFRGSGAQVLLGFDHPNYGHLALMPDSVRIALREDFA